MCYTIPVHLYLHTCTVLSSHQCTTPDCGVFFASRTVDFGKYQCWTPRSRGKSVFYSLRQCSPDNEPGMYVTINMECAWRWCVAIICCVYSVWTLNTKGVAVWYVLVRNSFIIYWTLVYPSRVKWKIKAYLHQTTEKNYYYSKCSVS